MNTCRFVANDQPRELANGDVCPRRHCVVCGHRHVEEITCPTCIGEARTALNDIRDYATRLLGEAVVKGVESEAANLAGPTAQPEAWRQRRRYGLRDKADDVVGEDHPLWILSTWDLLVTEHYGHHRATRVTIETAGAYLAANLSDLAQDGDFAFDDLVHDLRRGVGHLEAVLHAGEQHDTGAPCMTCGVPLERTWGAREADDGWACPRCRERSTDAQYRFAVAHLHREEAAWLTDRDMEIRTGVKAGTVRVLARRGEVERRTDSGRVLYAVADVERRAGITRASERREGV